MCSNQKLGTMREFYTRNFHVVCDAFEDWDVDLSWDEDGSVRKGLESGKLVCFTAHVVVYFKGHEVGEDYLGGCIYGSLAEFMDHKECGKQNREWEAEGQPGRCGSYFRDMIRTACAEARKNITRFKDIRIRAVA